MKKDLRPMRWISRHTLWKKNIFQHIREFFRPIRECPFRTSLLGLFSNSSPVLHGLSYHIAPACNAPISHTLTSMLRRPTPPLTRSQREQRFAVFSELDGKPQQPATSTRASQPDSKTDWLCDVESSILTCILTCMHAFHGNPRPYLSRFVYIPQCAALSSHSCRHQQHPSFHTMYHVPRTTYHVPRTTYRVSLLC